MHEAGAPEVSDALIARGVPILGICYGMQALAAKFGGVVAPSQEREFGYAEVQLSGSDPLLAGLGKELKVWMSHGDRVERLPQGFTAIASSTNAPLAAMADVKRRIYGLQFHPEVTHTEHGFEIIGRFVRDICGCAPTWTAQNIIAEHIDKIRATVGKDRVLLGLSGGVDSSVVAALLHAAIGEQLTCVFVDTGLLRLHEGDQVMRVFDEHLGVNVIRVDAGRRVHARARRRRGSGRQAQDHRPRVRRGVRGRGGKAQRRALARARHDLSGRDRIRRRRNRQGASDQVASQRRRLAGAHEAQAHRAAAGSFQGRGAQDRRGSSACRPR